MGKKMKRNKGNKKKKRKSFVVPENARKLFDGIRSAVEEDYSDEEIREAIRIKDSTQNTDKQLNDIIAKIREDFEEEKRLHGHEAYVSVEDSAYGLYLETIKAAMIGMWGEKVETTETATTVRNGLVHGVPFVIDYRKSEKIYGDAIIQAASEVFEEEAIDNFLRLCIRKKSRDEYPHDVVTRAASDLLIKGANRLKLKVEEKRWPFENIIVGTNDIPLMSSDGYLPTLILFMKVNGEIQIYANYELMEVINDGVDAVVVGKRAGKAMFAELYSFGEWRNPPKEIDYEFSHAVNPWYVVALLEEVINERSNIVVSNGKGVDFIKHKSSLSSRIKKKKPPYYPVELKRQFREKIRREREEAKAEARRLKFRHSRIGHEKAYVRRGPLPLHPSKRRYYLAKHMDAGVRIYENGSMSDHDIELLTERGMPLKRDDEWMVIWTRWVKDTIVGDENLPFIPSSRV